MISIITVCYNAQDKIETTIQSVLNQTHKDIQYIIIDGNSTDGTQTIIEQYLPQISYYISEPDKGIYDAMNKGIQQVRGDWVHFLNAGDLFYEENTLKQFVPFLEEKASLIYGDIFRKEVNGELIFTPQQGAFIYGFFRNICHQAILYNVKKCPDLSYDTQYTLAADADLLLRIVLKYPNSIKKVAKPMAIYESGGISDLNLDKIHMEHALIFRSRFTSSFSYFWNFINLQRQKIRLRFNL